MRKLKLYFDTSVFNFAFADDSPNEKEVTLKLLEEVRKGKYEIYISDVVIREILEASVEKAEILTELINEIRPLELTFNEECELLAREYIGKGIIPEKYEDDAFHIAVASANDMDAIISWNFSHIVKLKTKREVVGINMLMGYKEIDIYSPREVVEDEGT